MTGRTARADELLKKIMNSDIPKLEQGFKDVIGPLPDYKRVMAYEYINALMVRLEYEQLNTHELSEELSDHRAANRVLRPTHDMPAIDAPQGAPAITAEPLGAPASNELTLNLPADSKVLIQFAGVSIQVYAQPEAFDPEGRHTLEIIQGTGTLAVHGELSNGTEIHSDLRPGAVVIARIIDNEPTA